MEINVPAEDLALNSSNQVCGVNLKSLMSMNSANLDRSQRLFGLWK